MSCSILQSACREMYLSHVNLLDTLRSCANAFDRVKTAFANTFAAPSFATAVA
jgi:hypothetical protein